MPYNIRYPMITGPSEKERSIQIKSFLHQLVDELNYTLNNIDTVQTQYIKYPAKSESSKKEEDVQKKLSFISDYVTEAGEINGWKYKKWSNGTFDMFGIFKVKTTTAGTAYGSMYCSEQFILPSPFALSSVVAASGSATNCLIPIIGDLEGDYDPSNYIGFKLLSPSELAVGEELSVRLHIEGEYTFIQEEK